MLGKAVLPFVLVGSLSTWLIAVDPAEPTSREAARKLYSDGNYREAYEAYRRLALNENGDPQRVGSDLEMGIQALRHLARVDETDAFREVFIETHREHWQPLHAAANSYAFNAQHFGYIVAGEFHRGQKRGGDATMVNSFERDRVRALQLMQQALPIVRTEPNKHAAARFHFDFARIIQHGRQNQTAWRLQYLTDLSELPDYDEHHDWWSPVHATDSRGAPVDAEGNPIYYHTPDSFEAAASDGERWRWMLHKTAELAPSRANEVDSTFAAFLRNQFGVRTMRYYGRVFGPTEDDTGDPDDSGPFALHTLEEDETIARLATGVKRFELPEEFNFIRIYQRVASSGKNSYAERALNTLAEIFEDRRQYPRAAEYWRESIERFGPGSNRHKQQRLEQIVANWGRFENATVHPAGQGATVDFRFRNGKQVRFEAHRIKIDKLLADVKAYLKSNPDRLDWQKMNIDSVGYRLVEQNQNEYRGERVAQWTVDLEPGAAHFDKRITLTTPLEQAGAYLLTGQMADGNTSRIIVWIADTVIANKQLDGKSLYYVADAVTGKPIQAANVEFFGYRQESVGRNRYRVLTSNFAEASDASGFVVPDPKLLDDDYNWLATVRTRDGRFAHLGFSNVWVGHRYDPTYHQRKAFVMTDRPVYRPEQPVQFKFWVRHARYDLEEVSQFAGQRFTAIVQNPLGESVFEETFQADDYGGFNGEYALPGDATLGRYSIRIKSPGGISGGGHFRVEEYKKPEFEVTVNAPDEPVALGETITASINASYYFGAPVAEATVHYKVERTSYTGRWYPYGPWDWLYGRGYWWFAPDYEWFPGWPRWGCVAPRPFWWPVQSDPPEVVLDNEVEIGPDGTVEIEIDTALAKAVHGDTDHRYQITAEVVDQSRRTIVGTGEVLVAREPFQVTAWVDRGWYRSGDTVEASFKAHTLDRQPVEGQGKLTLYKIDYQDAQPVETAVETWDVDTNDRGEASQKFTAAEPGQYRLSYEVTDAQGRTIEGGYVFNVIGERFDSADYRFNDIELIPDARQYAPGENVRLLVNTNRTGGTVLLFIRPTNGVYLKPQVLRLDGKSTTVEIPVEAKDMPNFFVEAMTISGGKIHTAARDVAVPPQKRIVNVEVEPSASEFKPGEAANVRLKLTDREGNPFVGSMVLSIYDKSVEYISGGTNVGDIKEFFWKFRRHHHPRTQSNLDRYFGNLVRSGETRMRNIGAFGDLIFPADDADGLAREEMEGGTFGRARNQLGAMDFSARAGKAVAEMAAPAAEARADAAAPQQAQAGGEQQPQQLVEPTVRQQFADTALWEAALVTDENGLAEVSLTMPENLTTWKIRTWGMGHGTRVGEGTAEVVTTKDLLVRLQAPRFFTETDEVVLSANVHNYLETAKSAQVVLELEGETLSPTGSLARTVEVPADGEVRVDWRVKAVRPGEATVRMKALTDEESDAMQMDFPVHVHGMLQTESFAGVIRPEKSRARIDLRVPEKRQINQSRLEVRYSPTLAGAMVDALPYLVSYPYKTCESTLNRFLPTVITQNILKRMNLDLEEIKQKRTNLNAQEIGEDRVRARQWKRYEHNPVFDEAEVEQLVKRSVKDLTEMQLPDGGWKWFAAYEGPADTHMTALVVHGLQLAEENGVALVPGVLENGVKWLELYQQRQVQLLQNALKQPRVKPYKIQASNLDAFVFMVLIDAGVKNDDMRDFLYRDRTKLSVYAMGMYGLALHALSEEQKLEMIVRNIDQYLVQDDENQTAYLKLPGSYWWYWYGSETEANAYYLKLLSRMDPKGEKASRLVKYLLNNRKHATWWNSTRDTAIAVEAMAEYLVASGEDRPDLRLAIYFDGRKEKEVHIDAENLFSFDNKFVLEGDAVPSGVHTVELRKSGAGPVYFNAYLTNFTQEDHIAAAGLELKVHRAFYKLIREDEEIKVSGSRGQAVDQRVEKYRREDLVNFESVESGDLIEVELTIESKNDYEYLVFEDLKPAGAEPVDVRSGYHREGMSAYMELRDRAVTFFKRRLPRGTHSIAYRVRAETPGRFSALPTKAYAMYAPELKGNSEEMKLVIVD